ncbi:MAG: hypothetical protein ACLRIT_12115 [Blautia sp.]
MDDFFFWNFPHIKNPSQAYHLKRIFLLLIFVSDQISALFASETFFTKATIATIAARRIITNGRIGVLSPVLTAVLAVEFDEPDV